MRSNNLAVVLGGYLNGFSIIQELYECGVPDIALIQYGKQLGGYSNKLKKKISIDKNSDSLKKAIFELKEDYEYLILYPTDDLQLELLKNIENEIKEFCYLPYNSENLLDSSDKSYQYKMCEKLKVPYPKTITICNISEIIYCDDLMFPLIIKPNTRKDLTKNVFRSLFITDPEDLIKNTERISSFLDQGITFLVSEVVPGNTAGNIYAYTAFRNKSGKILSSWIGKKLTQYPDDYGVFSSACNVAPDIIEEQGKTLVNGMNLFGIVEPEFKYDYRDGKYKLMEINLRSMMWHRTGNRSGVNLEYSQWLDAIGGIVPEQKQERNKIIHFSYLKHELINLVQRKGYTKYFFSNLFGGQKNYWAIFDIRDIKPFLFDFKYILKGIIKAVIKTIKNGQIE